MTAPEGIPNDHLRQLLAEKAGDRPRFILAISGPPGAGKSTLANNFALSLNADAADTAIVVPMDGFHFDDAVLRQRGLLERKGAPETFDVDGFAALLARLARHDRDVAIPLFDRTFEISRAGAAIVTLAHRILIVEGNYLLLDEPPWRALARYFDFSIALEVDVLELEARLVRRWLTYGLDMNAARARVLSNDMPNVRRVLAHSRPADFVISAR